MTLAELINRFRIMAFDNIEPYFFSDEQITMWLNDAEKEACIRGRLIHDFTTPDVCKITLEADKAFYPLHSAFYEIEYLGYEYVPAVAHRYDEEEKLTLISQEDMTAVNPHWRHEGRSNKYHHLYGDNPRYAVQHDTGIRLVPAPKYGGKLYVEGYRVPIHPMQNMEDTPEIHAIHHEYLALWALHRGFSVPDTETFDPTRAAKAEAEFTDYFGIRPDSDLRRITREDVPHTVDSFWV